MTKIVNKFLTSKCASNILVFDRVVVWLLLLLSSMYQCEYYHQHLIITFVLPILSYFSETYHMITQGDQKIASWTGSGDSFTIHDIRAFEMVSKMLQATRKELKHDDGPNVQLFSPFSLPYLSL